MKVLNLYAGIGGNRKQWTDVEVTAVEINPDIAKIYQDFFPDDKMVIGDAHQYLLEHYGEYDFIWSSPPCPTHSRINTANVLSPYKDNSEQIKHSGGIKPRYPDMSLYQEIIFLKHFFKGKYCVENVISYYEPLIRPRELQRHYFWSNFFISERQGKTGIIIRDVMGNEKMYGFDINKYKIANKRKILRNMVSPYLGLHILNESKRNIQPELF